MLKSRGYSSAEYVAASPTSAEQGDTSREQKNIKPFSDIPGPKPLPILHNLLDFRRNSGRVIYYLQECYKKYGEIFKMEIPG